MTDLRRCKASVEWMRSFVDFRKKILPPFDPGRTKRVRLTVIDTGIDASHPFVAERWSKQRWNQDRVPLPLFNDFTAADESRKADPVDEDGHGTFIAGLVLQVAPDVELSVARIARDRETLNQDRGMEERIAQVG